MKTLLVEKERITFLRGEQNGYRESVSQIEETR